MKSCIICLGNRLISEDFFGPAVFDNLQTQPVPCDIEIIDGGTAGLNLLPLLERSGTVVFVDSVSGFGALGEIVLLDQSAVKQGLKRTNFGHDFGLAYLLAMLPKVCSGEIPDKIFLVGFEGECAPQTVDKAAKLALETAAYH